MATMAQTEHRLRESGTRAILDALLDGDANETPDLRSLFHGLGRRGFGMLLFVGAMPAFIPIPVGGAVSGPLVVLIAMQLLVGRRKPWLPGFIARRVPRRQTLARFDRMVEPWLRRLERLLRPRLLIMFEHGLASSTTGLLLLLLGILLALPIPLTNYLFGGIVLLFALALLEHDGVLMLAAWALGLTALVATVLLSDGVFTMIQAWLAQSG
jgi:hypothetical protein